MHKGENHQHTEENNMHKYVLEHFLDSYLVERNVLKTMDLVTRDIYSLGTGVQEIAHNKEEFYQLVWSEIQQLSMPILYSLDTYYEKQVAPDVFCCFSDVTTIMQMEEQPDIRYTTRLTAGFRKEGDIYLAYHLHMSEASATQEEHEFFPLHYGNIEPIRIDEQDQMGLVELMKKTIPGGAMGGYAEPGFPLYFINDELLELLGYTYDEFIAENGQMMINTMHPDDGKMVEETIQEKFAKGDDYVVEYRMRKKDQSYIWVRDIGRKTITPSGRTAMISIIMDISSEKQKQQSFEATILSMKTERRRIDRMTGLLNREPAEILIEQSIVQNQAGALFMMDIDNFKLVNDTKGHPAGDQVLRHFAGNLMGIFPEEAILARLGGDEFICFVPTYDSMEELRDLADKVLEKSTHLVEDYVLANTLGVSIGIALAPEDGEDFATLYSNADKGQYYAKRNGKGRYSFYGQESVMPASRDARANMDTLRRMVQSAQADKGAFLVEYEAFHKIYQFVERNVGRMKRNTHIILFSIYREVDDSADNEEKRDNRRILENAIRYQLRNGDLMMDFSNDQIAVLLINCDVEDANAVASRVLSSYLSAAGTAAVEVTYELENV